MASNAVGYYSPTDADNPYNTAAQLQIGYGDQVGVQKLGAINNYPNSVAAVAVRQKTISFNLTTDTQTAIAHGCVDSAGNPTVPLSYAPLYSSSNGYYPSQAPDATNIYLTAPAGATTAVTGDMVVFY